jgi:hypothetical protein
MYIYIYTYTYIYTHKYTYNIYAHTYMRTYTHTHTHTYTHIHNIAGSKVVVSSVLRQVAQLRARDGLRQQQKRLGFMIKVCSECFVPYAIYAFCGVDSEVFCEGIQ